MLLMMAELMMGDEGWAAFLIGQHWRRGSRGVPWGHVRGDRQIIICCLLQPAPATAHL